MPTPQKMLSNLNLLHPPQYVIEGTGPGNYAKTLTGVTMKAPLQLTKMDIAYGNEYVERLYKGDFDKEDEIKVWEKDVVTIMGNVPINNEGLGQLDWCMNKPPLYYSDSAQDSVANRAPHQSRTWLCSFVNAKNKIVYIIGRGCKPQGAKISIQNKALAEFEMTLSTQRVYAITTDTTAPADGTVPTTAAELLSTNVGFTVTKLATTESKARPLRFENALDFQYDPVGSTGAGAPALLTTALQYDSIEVGIDWELREQNSNGTIRSLFVEQAGRAGSGNVAIYKTGQELNEDARTDYRKVGWFPLSAGTDVHSKATVVASSVVFFAALPGAAGNGIKVEVKAKHSSNTKNLIEVEGKKITITPAASPTWAAIKADLDNDRAASLLGSLAVKGTPAAPSAAIPEVMTSGGTDGARKIILNKMRFEPSNEQMLGQTSATIESKTLNSFSVISKNVI